MSRIVTPEKPLRANAILAASRIACRVRSDFLVGVPTCDASGAKACCFSSDFLALGIKAARPRSQGTEPRRLGRREPRSVQVLLVVPDPDVVRQGKLCSGEPLCEFATVFADPIAREDVRRGVVYRSWTH